ncbi:MAG: hypothetical protein ACRECW_12270 [Phyllobacterium sp.]
MGAGLSYERVKQNWIIGGILAVIAMAALLSVAYEVEVPADPSDSPVITGE